MSRTCSAVRCCRRAIAAPSKAAARHAGEEAAAAAGAAEAEPEQAAWRLEIATKKCERNRISIRRWAVGYPIPGGRSRGAAHKERTPKGNRGGGALLGCPRHTQICTEAI